MEKKTRRAQILERIQKQKAASRTADPWESILPNISKGCVIPVISNSFRVEQIFHELTEDDSSIDRGSNDDGLTVVEGLVADWAQEIGYPMQDRSNLAQVAQYFFVEQNYNPSARTAILNFFKKFLWNMAETEVGDPALAAGLDSPIEDMLFSDLVEALDYPKFQEGTEDSLRLLARFPLPIYITTSQSNFIERALEAEGKKPCTQICFWSVEMTQIRKEHRTNRDFSPSVTEPLVYHLYGLENYPQTLVLSEDDYINFLISVTGDNDSLNPKIPLSLRQALGESQLLLIGYQLSDWDFRVLFPLIMKFRDDEYSPRGMIIQLHERKNELSNTNAVEYLKRYFDRKSFEIILNDADTFIQNLWDKWDTHRQGKS
jgi:hypothetical protein